MGGSGEGSRANTGAAAKPAGSGDSELGQGHPRAATGGDPEFLGWKMAYSGQDSQDFPLCQLLIPPKALEQLIKQALASL